jgi:hypothetical protein
MKSRIFYWLGALLAASLACQTLSPATETQEQQNPSVSTSPRSYETETFRFTIPEGWQTMEELWERPRPTNRDYYHLGVIEIITITSVQVQGASGAFFAVASSPLAGGAGLEERFESAYAEHKTEIQTVSQQPFERNELIGYEITYKRPWGEPWWMFRDIWLEKDSVIYVLSLHVAPASFENYIEVFEEIVDSFEFKE